MLFDRIMCVSLLELLEVVPICCALCLPPVGFCIYGHVIVACFVARTFLTAVCWLVLDGGWLVYSCRRLVASSG